MLTALHETVAVDRSTEFVAFEDVIPVGTKYVVVAMKWQDYQGCPPPFTCWMSTSLFSRGS